MINRRKILKNSILFPFLGINIPSYFLNAPINANSFQKPILKTIAKTKENIASIGMGTWLTFDVGHNTKAIAIRKEVLEKFFTLGGQLIDSSPMYGTSERVIGKCLKQIKASDKLFSATKIWTPNAWHGKKQLENSINLWNIKNFDLLQVHNLVNYKEHLEYLFELKNKGKLKYVGVTTSHGWRHEKTKHIMENYDIDFVQFTYNILDREAENILLNLAYEKNISVIANRPYQGGNLFNLIKAEKLPKWAKDMEIKTWASFFLKYIISHKAVTCAIPATTQIAHMIENMEAMHGYIPTQKDRKRMENFIQGI